MFGNNGCVVFTNNAVPNPIVIIKHVLQSRFLQITACQSGPNFLPEFLLYFFLLTLSSPIFFNHNISYFVVIILVFLTSSS